MARRKKHRKIKARTQHLKVNDFKVGRNWKYEQIKERKEQENEPSNEKVEKI